MTDTTTLGRRWRRRRPLPDTDRFAWTQMAMGGLVFGALMAAVLFMTSGGASSWYVVHTAAMLGVFAANADRAPSLDRRSNT